MPDLSELIDTTGDEAKTHIKNGLLDLLESAKNDSEALTKETAIKVEKWLAFKLAGDIDSDELEALLNARRRTVQQFLNTQEIAARARLEKLTLGLIDLVLNKALDRIL